MKVRLLHPDRDVDPEDALPPNVDNLTQDLELEVLFDAMAGGDEFIFKACRRVVLSSLADPETITYRQDVVRDCLAHPQMIREVYALTVETLSAEGRIWGGNSPSTFLHASVEALQLFLPTLRQLKRISDEHVGSMQSEGLRSFLGMLAGELDDLYFAAVDGHLTDLRFRDGVLLSARLGEGNKGDDYVLRRLPHVRQSWLRRLFARDNWPYSFEVSERDEPGVRALAELRARGIVLVSSALKKAADHILGFLRMLQAELAFYVGCINAHTRLTGNGAVTGFPVPVDPARQALSARGLYDPCLSLRQSRPVVSNDFDADGRSLVMITGLNQGGKSTFLRSVGLAQLMLQCGMFVCADSFRASLCRGIFTHYKREEDPTMRSGKLDEELGRMSDIADLVSPGSLVLFNESFASTNEREGSQIAREVIRALREAEIRVVFVTHLFDLAHSLFVHESGDALFLQGERQADGRRTFRLVEGDPSPTSHGEDLYWRIFGSASEAAEVSP